MTPKVATVDGVGIYVQDERNAKHKQDHVHARGKGWSASVDVDNQEVIAGELPRNKRESVTDFVRDNKADLKENIETVKKGGSPRWLGGQ